MEDNIGRPVKIRQGKQQIIADNILEAGINEYESANLPQDDLSEISTPRILEELWGPITRNYKTISIQPFEVKPEVAVLILDASPGIFKKSAQN